MSTSSRRVPLAPFELDPRQREAIEHVHGPMLVVAGAGTGKTTVLTRRVARLIRDGHARADQILAVTYTENAAGEMRDRVARELKREPDDLGAGTFHAYCNNLLKRQHRDFKVLDDQDLWILLRRNIRDLNLKYFVRAANVGQFLDDLLKFIRRCHDELVGPQQYREYVARLDRGEFPIPRVTRSRQQVELSREEVLERCHEVAHVFETVERMLRERNFGTFGHMILGAYDILKTDAAVLEEERKRAHFVLVDEFQDANFAQMKVLELLAGEQKNIFAVGDPDQGIYQFRGASSAAFQMFLSRFPDTSVVRLDKNQRSTTAILKCAYEVIRENPPIATNVNGTGLKYQRTPLISARDEMAIAQGAPLPQVKVEVVVGKDKDVEACEIPNALKRKRRELRCDWSDFAILYRQHLHRELIAEELARNEIPISIEGMDILDTPVIRDILACLRAVASTKDSAALFRVAARPQFQMKADDLRAALKAAPAECTLAEVLAGLPAGKPVLDSIQQARERVERGGRQTADALEVVIRQFGFDPKDQTISALRKFIHDWGEKAITETKELGEFLEYMELFPEARGTIPLATGADKGVKLLTVHGAKGLEFAHVFIVRANSNSFPAAYKESLVEFPRELFDASAMVGDDSKRLHEQEERRLFYVAMTRAKDSLMISACRGRGTDATPAGYLRSLLKDRTLRPWLTSRDAKPLQVDLFAHAADPKPSNTIADWLRLPPAVPLNASLSASGIETYKTCPLQFKLERDWRIPREIPAALQYGQAIHGVLKHYYDSVVQGRPATEAELVALFHTLLTETPISDPYQRELYTKQGVSQLHAFLAAAAASKPPDVLRTEQAFSMKIGGAIVKGRIDRVDRIAGDSVVIVDYKTGKPKDPEDADESLQLSIYALAAQSWGYKPERLVFYNLEDNAAIETRRTAEQLQEAMGVVETVAEKIAQEKFDAKPGFHCRFCPYRSLCPFTEKQTYQAIPAAQSN